MASSARLLARNSLANLFGQLIYPVLSLALVPFYIAKLGLEGYGLVGFFTTIVAVLGVFTKGLSTALSREIARRGASEEGRQSLASLLTTFEVGYWVVGAGIGLALFGMSAFFGGSWLKVEAFPSSTVQFCLTIIAMRIALSFPSTVYHAALSATQDQVALSVLTSVFAVWTAACGALVVLIWGSIGAFYVSELLNAVLTTAVVRVYARRRIGRFGGTSTFRGEYLKALVRESVGLIWTNGIGGLITQLDRLFISRLLPATSLGTYVAATAGGRLLSMVYAPFFQASYPQLCELVATEGGAEKAGPVVIRNARIVAIACLSVGVPLAVFAEDFLAVWTRSAVVATQGGLAMGIYIGGSILIAFASVLYQAQVAMRIIRPSVVFNTAAIVWFPLTLWFLVSGWGIAGAACAWLCYGLATWLVSVVVTGGLVGRPGWWRGYLVGLLPVVVLAAGLTALARVVADTFTQQPLIRIALAVLGGALILMSAVLVTFGGALPREIKAIWRRRPSTAGDPGPSRPDAPRSEA